MALLFIGKATGGVCGAPICEGEDYVGFPAFLGSPPITWNEIGRPNTSTTDASLEERNLRTGECRTLSVIAGFDSLEFRGTAS